MAKREFVVVFECETEDGTVIDSMEVYADNVDDAYEQVKAEYPDLIIDQVCPALSEVSIH